MNRTAYSTTPAPGRKVIHTLRALCLMAGALALASCTSIQTNRTNGTSSLVSVGGNIQGYVATPEGAAVESVDNATSFREVTGVIRTGLWLAAAQKIADSISSSYTATQNAKAAADVSKHAATQGTKQAAIKADQAIKTFVPPEAAAAAVPLP